MNFGEYNHIFYSSLIYLGATILFLVIGVLTLGRDRRAATRLGGLVRSQRDEATGWSAQQGFASLLSPSIASTFLSTGDSRLQTQFRQAGVYSPAAVKLFRAAQWTLMLIPAIVVVGLYCLGFFSWTSGVLSGAIVAVLGAATPIAWLRWRKNCRQMLIRKSLPDFLDLTVTCMEAGLSIHASLREVASELQAAHPALSEELSIVLSELELGKTLEEGLRNFAERVEMEELRTLAAFVRHATQFGTTMADAIRQLSDMLRNQRELKAEELAQKAAVKILLPTLFFIFPTVFVVLVGPAAIQIHEGFKARSAAKSTTTSIRTEMEKPDARS